MFVNYRVKRASPFGYVDTLITAVLDIQQVFPTLLFFKDLVQFSRTSSTKPNHFDECFLFLGMNETILLFMYKGLQEIINSSTFTVIPGNFVYTQVRKAPPIDDHFLISKDENEITVVTKEEDMQSLELIERNKDTYSLIAVNVSVPFYSVGLLATISKAMADGGMDILIVSTYSRDYLMVMKERLEDAKVALINLGFIESSS